MYKHSHAAGTSCHRKVLLSIVSVCLLTTTPVYGYDVNDDESYWSGEWMVEAKSPEGDESIILGDAVFASHARRMGIYPGLYIDLKRGSGKYTRYYRYVKAACIPRSGRGTVGEAVKGIWDRYYRGAMAEWTQELPNNWAPTSSFVLGVPICGQSETNPIAYTTKGSMDHPTRTCATIMQPLMELGVLTADIRRSVPMKIMCNGEGSWDVRVIVEGNKSSQPTAGLTLWTEPPANPIRVSGGGKQQTTEVVIGATLNAPEAGAYSATFVYTLEYL